MRKHGIWFGKLLMRKRSSFWLSFFNLSIQIMTKSSDITFEQFFVRLKLFDDQYTMATM